MLLNVFARSLFIGTLLVFANVSHAAGRDYQQSIPKGFGLVEENTTETTIAGVLNSQFDGQLVSLKGRLTKYLGHEIYLFVDQTGEIQVELDDDHNWSHISKDAYIEIIGVVDRSFMSIKIDVKTATLLKQPS